MSIELYLSELTQALTANTAAINGLLASGTAVPSAKTETSTEKPLKAAKGKAVEKAEAVTEVKPEPEVKKGPVHTQAEVTTAIVKLKDTFGLPEAKKFVEALGFAKMSEITEDKFDEAFALAESRFDELTAEQAEEDADGGL